MTPPSVDQVGALAAELGLGRLQSLERFGGGTAALTFKLTTDAGAFVLKAFLHDSGGPLATRWRWIHDRLAHAGVPHARLETAVSAPAPGFGHGYVLYRFIDGQRGDQAVRSASCTIEDLYRELGERLRVLHDVRPGGFGSLPAGATRSQYLAWSADGFGRCAQRLSGVARFSWDLQKKVDVCMDQIDRLTVSLGAVLVHGDVSAHNCVWNGGNASLIDWDEARADFWLTDIAAATWAERFTHGWGAPSDERRSTIRRALLEGYGASASSALVIAFERPWHYLRTLLALSHHRFVSRDLAKFAALKWELERAVDLEAG